MDIQKHVEEFNELGYSVLEHFFEPSFMDACAIKAIEHYRDLTKPALEDDFVKASYTEAISWFPIDENVQIYESLQSHQTMDQLTEHLLGPGWSRYYCMVMMTKALSKGQAWHQDCLSHQPEAFNLNRLVYVSDVDESTGGQVKLVPGSHLMGRIPKGEPHGALEGEITLSPRKGSLILMHGRTFHRVTPVTAKADRISINCRALPPGVHDDACDYGVFRNMTYQFSTKRFVDEASLS